MGIVDVENIDFCWVSVDDQVNIISKDNNQLNFKFDPEDREKIKDIVKSIYVRMQKHREKMLLGLDVLSTATEVY